MRLMANLMLRYEVDLKENFKYLASVTKHPFYDIVLEILDCDEVNGIKVFGKEIADKLAGLMAVPVYHNGSVFEIPVMGENLFWKVENGDSIFEELGVETEDLYAATAFLEKIIAVNYWSVRYEAVADKKAAQEWLTNVFNELEAAVLKQAAQALLADRIVPSIRGRHVTMQQDFRNFVVPEELLVDYLRQHHVWKNMIVVDKDTAYFVNGKDVKKLLNKLGLKVRKFVRVEKQQLKTMVESYDPQTDTLIGHVFRHPIIGYIGIGTVVGAPEFTGIGVPADVASKLDGDDDGDLVDCTINVLVKNKKLEFATTLLDI